MSLWERIWACFDYGITINQSCFGGFQALSEVMLRYLRESALEGAFYSDGLVFDLQCSLYIIKWHLKYQSLESVIYASVGHIGASTVTYSHTIAWDLHFLYCHFDCMSFLSPLPRRHWAFKPRISWIITSINNWESVFSFVIFTTHQRPRLSALGRIPGKVKCCYCSYKIKLCTYLHPAFPRLFWGGSTFKFDRCLVQTALKFSTSYKSP